MIWAQKNVNLLPFNTFQVPCLALEFLEINTPEDTKMIDSTQNPLTLGSGANILFASPNYNGTVVKNNLKGKIIIKEDADNVWLEVASGENWHDFVMGSANAGWSGVENLALIPGSVGAAAVGNIGAYGQAAGESIEAVKTADGTVYASDQCQFYYRDSIFKHEFKNIISDIQSYPVNRMLYPNPDDPVFTMTDIVKIPAGRLLDELGWRGRRIGNVATFEKHALIVINCGGANGQEIIEFTQHMRLSVKDAYDIDLEPEVK